MSEMQRRLDEVRRERSELENHVIDEYLDRKISRQEFIRRSTVIGMSIPLVSWLAACGGGSGGGAKAGAAATTAAKKGTPGGTIRLGMKMPAGAVDPVTAADPGTDALIAQTGEYLTRSLSKPELSPILAQSWKPNKDASVWTFQLRQGVKFNDGAPFTAKDVVATMNRITDPANKPSALAYLGGVLSKGATSAKDDHTVVFELEAPNGNFAWLLSADNYSSIQLPASYDGDFSKAFPGTGALKLESFTPKVGAKFVRNPDYWGPKSLPDRVEITFFDDDQSKISALQGGQLDVIDGFTVPEGLALINAKDRYTLVTVRSTGHTELSMRNDKPPFTDKRVRQALALTLDRPAISQGLFRGYSQVGNDSPFSPLYPSTDRSVPQRTKDIAKAKELLAAAGHPNGFRSQINVGKLLEGPQYAQLVQQAARQIGVDLKLVVQDLATYYGNAVFGSSPWLDSTMSLINYGHRGVPNGVLTTTVVSKGSWNAAHFKHPDFDKLVADYVAALDLESQRKIARQIQLTLLDETPIIIPYFTDYLSAAAKGYQGVLISGQGHIWVDQAFKG